MGSGARRLEWTETASRADLEVTARLYEEAPDMFLSVEPSEARIVRCNLTTCRRLGYERHELIGMRVTDLYHPSCRDRLESAITQFKRLGTVRDVELSVVPRHGDPIPVLLNTTAVRDDAGKILYSASVWRDITDLKDRETRILELGGRLQQSLNDLQGEHAAILGAIPDLVAVIDEQGCVLSYKPEGANLDEQELAEAGTYIGRHISDILPPSFADILLYEAGRVLTTGRPQLFEHAVARDGRLRDQECRLSPTPAGRVVVIVRDVTESRRVLRALEEHADELARSNEELEQFAYVASHDLQEPLRMVASFTELLEREYGDRLDDEGRRFIDYAVSGARRMQQLILDLLAYSRVTRAEEAATRVDLNALLVDVRRDVRSLLEETGVQLIAGPLPVVTGSSVLLRQLLLNLIGNGVKFRRPDASSWVEVRGVDEPDRWMITVQDNGIGFDMTYADRIFQVFQRLHARDVYPGTGIGLAICKRVAERHGGQIWVSSTPGQGTCFHVSLPRSSSSGGLS